MAVEQAHMREMDVHGTIANNRCRSLVDLRLNARDNEYLNDEHKLFT